jgi:plastocyanin
VIRRLVGGEHGGVRRLSTCLICLICLTVAGCGSSGGGGGSSAQSSTSAATPSPSAAGPALKSATVDIKSFKFKPAVIAVRKGGRITWTNSDSTAHTATADARSFDTQTIAPAKSKTVSFTRAGSFAYHCDFHPFMKAMVVVR